ncbi:MAG: CotH kinase family protein [Thiotrichales bacterium]
MMGRIIPHDVNEAVMSSAGISGGRGDPGVELSPLKALNDPGKPLISRLLAVPKYRARYLELVNVMADKWLDWGVIGPVLEKQHTLIRPNVLKNTRRLTSNEEFEGALLELEQLFDTRCALLLSNPNQP